MGVEDGDSKSPPAADAPESPAPMPDREEIATPGGGRTLGEPQVPRVIVPQDIVRQVIVPQDIVP